MAKLNKSWTTIERQLRATIEGLSWVSALANASALLADSLTDINWVGFYLAGPLVQADLPAKELVLGPFQGKVACVRIPWGRGVCGTAAAENRTVLVDDVHAFPGHIACDSASRSEIVVPLRSADGHVVGVLDVDSPSLARFDEDDRQGFEACVRVVQSALRQIGVPLVYCR